jgi:hypothetical protein
MVKHFQDACYIIFCNQNVSHKTQANDEVTSVSRDRFATSTCVNLSGWMIKVKKYPRNGFTVKKINQTQTV